MSKTSVAVIAALCLVVGMVGGGIFSNSEDPTTWKMAIMESGEVGAKLADDLLSLSSVPVVGDSAIAQNIFIKVEKDGEPYVGVLYELKGIAVNRLPQKEVNDSTKS